MDRVGPLSGFGLIGIRARRSVYDSSLIDVLFGLTTASLFVEDAVGPGKSFLFIMLTGLLALIHAPLLLRRANVITVLSVPLLAFLTVHVGFALRTGEGAFELKLVQVLVALTFASTFALRYSQRSMKTYYKVTTVLILAVAVGAAAWHIVVLGKLVSWKNLWETKSAYAMLPFIMYAYLTARSPTARRLAPLIVAAFAVFILLSGERKAYLGLGLAILLMMNLRNPITYFLPLAVLLAQPLAIWLDPTGYVTKQISTFGPKDEAVFSVSDAQREWQFNYAKSLIVTHPIIGVGTNGYLPIIQSEFATAVAERNIVIKPGLGIHGEYLRVLVENGVVGLSLFALLIFSSAVRLFRGKHHGRPRSRREQLLAGFLFFVFVTRIGTEAYDTIMAVLYCMLPHLGSLRLDSRSAQARAPEKAHPSGRLAMPPPFQGAVAPSLRNGAS
jgi:hypothetical protein